MRIVVASIAARLAVVGVLLVIGGCARADWIESTLVTVDVTGMWAGEWRQPQFNGTLQLTLKQEGSKVTGDVRVTGLMDSVVNGAVEGNVNGDGVELRQWHSRFVLYLTVNGDEMTGVGQISKVGQSAVALRRGQ
jgi:hypothetical protein